MPQTPNAERLFFTLSDRLFSAKLIPNRGRASTAVCSFRLSLALAVLLILVRCLAGNARMVRHLWQLINRIAGGVKIFNYGIYYYIFDN